MLYCLCDKEKTDNHMNTVKNSSIRVALIGAGQMANKVYYPTLSSLEDVEIVGLCDRNSDKRHLTANTYNIEKTYHDYKKMVEELLPDAVFAIGHPHTMYDVWMWCLEKGLHLFIEKPLGITLHQTRMLAYMAERKKCITQVGFQRRASPLLKNLTETCKSRGQITYAFVEFIKNASDPFLCARDHMLDDGVHAIDTLRSICEGEVVEIHCITKRIGVPDLNFITATLTFDSGAIGQMHCNWTSGCRAFRVELHAPSICARADLEGKGYLYQDGNTDGIELDARQIAGSDDRIIYCGFLAKIKEFLSCVQTAQLPSSNFSDALKTHIVAEKILAKDLLS